MEQQNYKSKVSQNFSCFRHSHTKYGSHIDGSVITKQGSVRAYSQGGEHPHTSLDLVLDGYLYQRTWRKAMSQRGLAIMAGKFAREIAGNIESENQNDTTN